MTGTNLGKAARLALAAAFACFAASGCDLKTDGRPTEDEAPAAPSPKEAFRSPAPGGAGDDPRVAAAASASDAIARALGSIEDRLKVLRKSYDETAGAERDLKSVAERMIPLLSAAREDCDAILRAAKDLQVQLPFAAVGYTTAALSYRQRAETYADPDFKEITMEMAERFERHAADAPKRVAGLGLFVKELERVQAFLAETDRCLRDVSVAMSIFSAGGRPPKPSFEGRMFRLRLEEFIAVVAGYQRRLREEPGADAPAGATGGGATPAASTASPADASRSAPASPPENPEPSTRPTIRPTVVATRPAPAEAESRPLHLPVRAEAPRPVVWSGASPAASVRGAVAARLAARMEAREEAFAAGVRLRGTVSTPSRGFRSPVTLQIVERSGDAFSGIMVYGSGATYGRRGVRGTISPDGGVVMSADWFDGAVTPGPVAYELVDRGGTFVGTWRATGLVGTLALSR